ncbi:hypothetical protein [Pseudonocardia sp. McavD-2-B]|uniref:hypothetical protein n=1 Tax=Pseudonocardia sp. McavD-2-B TaxID=2954499 RepID=UPI00209852A9|nr:hypothetical protein [Pseudonocardia sp. McavD-2-B]MCO7193318.1 hypothetical protein [Pseudonocardia sp. McavD-2-B]
MRRPSVRTARNVWVAGFTLAADLRAAGLAGLGPEADRAQVRGFAVLSTLFGLNHLAAAVRAPRSGSNWFGAGLNAVGIAVGVAALAAPRPGTRAPDRR